MGLLLVAVVPHMCRFLGHGRLGERSPFIDVLGSDQ